MPNLITKAIIPIAGLGTRFLPLSKVVPKELFPLVDKPTLQYIIEEARDSGIKEIIFVSRKDKKLVLDYFEKDGNLEKVLKERKKQGFLKGLKELQELKKSLSFSQVFQREPRGDGQAVLTAKKAVGKEEPFAVLFSDDIVDSKVPCLFQLIEIFRIYKVPILALSRLPKEKLPFYGVVAVKKIGQRLYQIKNFIEKPKIEEAPSNLAVVGKYVLTPEVFDELEKISKRKKSDFQRFPERELRLANAFLEMIKDGKIILGYEFEGKWLECGNKLGWLESNLYLSLKHLEFSQEIKSWLAKLI